MENKELIKELETRFEVIKKELGFKTTLKELDEIFFIRDSIQNQGFISTALSRQICSRIIDAYGSWNNYLQALLVPNPNSIANVTESNAFDDQEKDDINMVLNQTMGLISSNTLAGIAKDKALEARFIDNSVKFWKETFKPKVIEIIKKVNKNWNDICQEKL